MNLHNPKIPVQTIDLRLFFEEYDEKLPQLSILRTDVTDEQISGNKWYKLKYNLTEAKKKNLPILTFGGAFSNHIAATAAAGEKYGVKTIGVIRGEEHLPLNSTLQKAKNQGMELFYLSRTAYRNKYAEEVLTTLKSKFGAFHLVPEGGSNQLALKGVQEMLSDDTVGFDYIVLASGTGGTTAGLYLAKQKNQKLISIPVLKGANWMPDEIKQLTDVDLDNSIQFYYNYHFGGYAKINNDLIAFANNFFEKTNIPLDLIYTTKALCGLFDLIDKKYFSPSDKILFVHTGGLQGNEGLKVQKQIDLKC
tara:strand:+ start:91605 stop:92525 length:921 start_codon:yes stop_codon:yes gene_type:complete